MPWLVKNFISYFWYKKGIGFKITLLVGKWICWQWYICLLCTAKPYMSRQPCFQNRSETVNGSTILSLKAFSWMTFVRKGLFVTLSKNDTQQNNALQFCWVSICWVSLCWVSFCWVSLCWVSSCWVRHFIYCYAKHYYSVCSYAEYTDILMYLKCLWTRRGKSKGDKCK